MIKVLSIAACLMTMTASFRASRGRLKPMYRLGLVNGLTLLALNGLLAATSDSGVAFMMIPSAWGALLCVLGLRRLRKAA